MSNVVITGVGACTSFANNASQLWNRAENISRLISPSERSPKSTQLAFHFVETASREALQNAGLWDGEKLCGIDPTRLGCTVSASKPIFSLPSSPAVYSTSFPRKRESSDVIKPLDPPLTAAGDDGRVIAPDVVNDWVCENFQVQGERRNVIAACATGAYSVALAASWIEQGLCDVVLAGSVEPPAHPLIEAGFRQMGVLSEESTMRPFDRRRSGFVMAEGGGVIVLESRAHANHRGAKYKTQLSGWGWGSDSHSAVAFNSGGERIASVIRQALRRSGLSATAIQHINAHGTATHLNDWIETQALIKAFGKQADQLMISATKSSTGHLLGAAGSIELILTVQALQEQFIPPTTHLEQADPDCSLDYTPQYGHTATFEHALSLSFGFGGPIGALVVSHA